MNGTIESLSNATVLITGAAMGMGRMYAHLAVSDHAAHVVLWDVNEQQLGAAVAELSGRGSQIHSYVVDVSKLEDIEAAAEKVRNDVGAPDILINNAGIVRGKYFGSTTSAATLPPPWPSTRWP